ncbi:hypothetical protein [Leifsonia sp. 71-9]|uniref:hypothetical protein n=1 Tax=Leifsonia sp. 71-9 TaxID=1895934 RepID=UPI00092679F1|nr:hypothetical protein [Leifsonia sp. 71-9]OJX78155.1 MAG: hypothetical protein BGO91_09835 [Leifsonia sp. 71-9]
MATRSVRDGFHEETKKVSTLTSRVASTKDGWDRGEPLNVPGARTVSKIYADLSSLIATYGELARKDTEEFDRFAVNIEVQDREDAKQ